MGSQKIIFLPSLKRRGGYGHLKRCLALAERLSATLYWPEGEDSFQPGDHGEISPSVKIIHHLPDTMTYELGVLDQRSTPVELLARVRKSCGVVLGLDEGGSHRESFSFLLDILGNLSGHQPNLKVPFWACSTGIPTLEPKKTTKLLVSFGGEDPKDLTGQFYRYWQQWKEGRPEDVTVVMGPYFRISREYPGWTVLQAPENLPQLMPGYSDLVTSYGLTAWEGVCNGLSVVLINPSSYHEKLARKAGFATAEVRNFPQVWRPGRISSPVIPPPEPGKSSLAEFLEGFSSSEDRCPVCSSQGRQVLYRGEKKTYSRCHTCSMVYLTAFNIPAKAYVKSYFHEEYKKQYGRTYLEDFDHIKSMGAARVSVLRSLGLRDRDAILDAGCAYGPFLAAARDAGLAPAGLDVASDAVAYLNQTLGIPAVEKSLLDLDWSRDFPESGPLKALTLWYVIEHFPDLDRVLRVLNANLVTGGLLGFSTPNFRGITGIFSQDKFFRESPEDHFSLWSPKIASKVLARYGFRVEKVRITGHHPERFPGLKENSRFGPRVVGLLSRWWGWGDTFEVYARKIKDVV